MKVIALDLDGTVFDSNKHLRRLGLEFMISKGVLEDKPELYADSSIDPFAWLKSTESVDEYDRYINYSYMDCMLMPGVPAFMKFSVENDLELHVVTARCAHYQRTVSVLNQRLPEISVVHYAVSDKAAVLRGIGADWFVENDYGHVKPAADQGFRTLQMLDLTYDREYCHPNVTSCRDFFDVLRIVKNELVTVCV